MIPAPAEAERNTNTAAEDKMMLAAAVFCLAYYLIICMAMGKWKSTFAWFWPGAGAVCLLGHAAALAGPSWLELAVESSFSIALFVFAVVEMRILLGMRPDREADCPFIIVLGAHIQGTKVTGSLSRRLEHGEIVGLVTHAVDVLHRDPQPLGQPADHAAFVGTIGGHLQQRLAGEDQLIRLRPALAV